MRNQSIESAADPTRPFRTGPMTLKTTQYLTTASAASAPTP